MPSDPENLLRRLIGGDDAAPAEVLVEARTSTAPVLLVAAALVAPRSADAADLLGRAAACATTTRDRQLVAVAAAHLADDHDRLDALVRDHLADHPDNVLAAWIAALHARTTIHPANRPTSRPETHPTTS